MSVEILITAAELQRRLREDKPPVLLDVRWALGDHDGHQHFLDGHLPGAVYVDLETELAASGSPAGGRHPLPELGALEASARRWGINSDSAIVIYDAVANVSAARAWWLLRWGGLADVRMLDGGIGAWERAGGPLQNGESTPLPGNVVITGGHMPVLDIDAAARMPTTGLLLDARAGERYRGEVEPIDPRAGHIPGALSAPTAENLAVDGTFLDPGALRARFSALGVRAGGEVGVYCGSGVSAAHEIAALELAGFGAALYPGSWSQWSSDPQRPVAT
ncbi:MAG TPA: sulfurtransferase [Solirubrobacteraceae bacterium]